MLITSNFESHARKLGVDDDALDALDDADDPKAAMVALIIKYEAPADDNEALIAELEAMKPGARRKRAVAAGATEDELEEADDADHEDDNPFRRLLDHKGTDAGANGDNLDDDPNAFN